MITAEIFQHYTWFLEDLTDSIVGSLTDALTKRLAEQTAYATAHQPTQAVSQWLTDQNNPQAAAFQTQ